MEKSIFEQMGGSYHKQGDYFLPDLAMPDLSAYGPSSICSTSENTTGAFMLVCS